MKKIILGAEAIAQGALDGGISGVYAYPGTPSTEITEYIQNHPFTAEFSIHSQWAANEKTAMESALGMSYAGKRALVCMKHVGLNVAADCFMNAAITGVNGGMVIAVADDPSMHSSQNEQDSRYFGRFAQIPVLEPTNQQEAYDMAYSGFELSEKYQVPVLLRITTRLAHSRAIIEQKPVKSRNSIILPSDKKQFILMPAIARKQYHKLLVNQTEFQSESEQSEFNRLIKASNLSLGIIACGIAFNYLMENFDGQCPYPVVKVSQYPFPQKPVNWLFENCQNILVLEEGYPILEEILRGFPVNPQIKGRLDGTLPREGELNPDLVAFALKLKKPAAEHPDELVANRPPSLCQGCSHHDVYTILNQVMDNYTKGRVFSDIGCYTLGALPPYEAIYSCVDMGASITMAKGAADAGLVPSVAVIGDSTFTHSGITGLLDAVNENSPITIIISDNESTSMTGGQDSSAKGRIETICEGIGVNPDHIHIIAPLKKNHDEMLKVFSREIAYQGVSVIIARRVCIQKNARDVKAAKVSNTLQMKNQQ